MNYRDLYIEFKDEFKEDKNTFKTMEEENLLGLNDPAMVHVYFYLIVSPYSYGLLRDGNEEKLKKLFAFFEEMAKDSDPEVQGVLQFGLLENLTTESKEIYKAA